MGPGPVGAVVQIRMDDCTKEPPAGGLDTLFQRTSQERNRTMEPGRFERVISRCKTADSRRPNCRRIYRRKEFRLGESISVFDKNPLWMTLFFRLPFGCGRAQRGRDVLLASFVLLVPKISAKRSRCTLIVGGLRGDSRLYRVFRLFYLSTISGFLLTAAANCGIVTLSCQRGASHKGL
jgi:hypothetical protein